MKNSGRWNESNESALGLLAVLAVMVAVGLLVPNEPPAQAQTASDWKMDDNVASTSSCGGSISSGRRCYYPFTGSTNSTVKDISAEYATVCLDPNLATTGTSLAQVQIMRVTGNLATGAVGDPNKAEPLLDLTLTGTATGGADCIYEVPAGRYYVSVTSSPAGADAVVSIHGAGTNR